MSRCACHAYDDAGGGFSFASTPAAASSAAAAPAAASTPAFGFGGAASAPAAGAASAPAAGAAASAPAAASAAAAGATAVADLQVIETCFGWQGCCFVGCTAWRSAVDACYASGCAAVDTDGWCLQQVACNGPCAVFLLLCRPPARSRASPWMTSLTSGMQSWSAGPALLSSTPRRWRRSGPLQCLAPHAQPSSASTDQTVCNKPGLLLAPCLLDQPLSLTTTLHVWLQWDAAILSNRRALLELEEELRKVVKGQESLEKKLQVGGSHCGARGWAC